jgi:hypothetical protein
MAYLPLTDGSGAVPTEEIEALLSKYLDNDNTLDECLDDVRITHDIARDLAIGDLKVDARDAVVLGLNSPQLLELSGIGRTDLLQTHGIPVIVDNPAVGPRVSS